MKNTCRNYPRARGFTLIELMVTVAILAILVAIGVPAMNSFLNSNRLTAHTSALKQAIQYARSEAVSKNQNVSVCASADGLTCNGTWSDGWIVLLDEDDTVLRVWNGLSDDSSIAGGATVTFTSAGERVAPEGNITFQIENPSGSIRNLQISNVGWVTVTKGGSS